MDLAKGGAIGSLRPFDIALRAIARVGREAKTLVASAFAVDY